MFDVTDQRRDWLRANVHLRCVHQITTRWPYGHFMDLAAGWWMQWTGLCPAALSRPPSTELHHTQWLTSKHARIILARWQLIQYTELNSVTMTFDGVKSIIRITLIILLAKNCRLTIVTLCKLKKFNEDDNIMVRIACMTYSYAVSLVLPPFGLWHDCLSDLHKTDNNRVK